MISRRNPPIEFTNLVDVRINILNAKVAITSKSVTKLTLFITPHSILISSEERRKLILHITKTMPTVQTLRIVGDSRICACYQDIILLCKGLPKLRRLILPSFAMNNILLSYIANRGPTLTTLDVLEGHSNSMYPYIPNTPAAIPTWPKLGRNAFMQIRDLALSTASPFSFTPFIEDPNFPGFRLRKLWLRFTLGPFIPASEVRTLLKCLNTSCMNLVNLTIHLGPYTAGLIHEISYVQALTYADIEPIFHFEQLAHLFIHHPAPLSISSADAYHIAEQCPRFETLWLNPQPTIRDAQGPPPLPLHCLAYFAQHCQHLRSIGLYFNGTSTNSNTQKSTPKPRRFSRVNELFVGSSPIPTLSHTNQKQCMSQWRTIARLFSTILPSSTQITTAEDYFDPYSIGQVNPRTRPHFTHCDGNSEETTAMRRAWFATLALSSFLTSTRDVYVDITTPARD